MPSPLRVAPSNSRPLRFSGVGGTSGQEMGSSLDGEQLGEESKEVGTLVRLPCKAFVERECIAKSVPVTLVSFSCLTNLCKGNG